MIRMTVRTNPSELKAIQQELERLRESVQRKALRRGVTKGARVVAKKAKTLVPVQTRTLQRSLGAQTRKARGGVIGIAGVRKGFARNVRIRTVAGGGRGRRARYREERRDPVAYAPTVNKRTRFLSKALEQSEGPIRQIMAEEVKREVER